MSTRANVGVLQNDGTVKVIYSHWDGYPDYLFKTLKKYHNSLDKATALISLGDASYIGRYIEPSEGVKLFGFDFMPDLPEYAEQLAKLPVEQVRRIKNEGAAVKIMDRFFRHRKVPLHRKIFKTQISA